MIKPKKIPSVDGGRQAAGSGIPADLIRAAQEIATSVSFMPGAESGGFGQGGGDPGSGHGFTAAIDLHLRAVLGRVPTSSKNFVEALDRSIELVEEEGHKTWRLANRSGAGARDFGTSGALPTVQGLVATKAQEALAIFDPIVKQLPNLNKFASDEEVDAVRSNLETEFHNLVEELGRQTGIRKERADTLFANILGERANNEYNRVDPESLFGIFAAKAGYVDDDELDDGNVTSLEEEQNLADLVAMRGALLSFWQSYRHYKSSAKLFFSDELFNLSRALLAIQEATQAVEQALDSVALGESRRQMLPSNPHPTSMKLQDLLDWAGDFAAEEAPQILEHGGRFGLQRLKLTLGKLGTIIRAVKVGDTAFKHPRVQRAWKAFEGAVRDAAESIPAVTGRARPRKKSAK